MPLTRYFMVSVVGAGIWLGSAFGAFAQIPETISSPPSQSGNLSLQSDSDYLIGENDVLEIKISDAPELSGTFKLNAEGILTIPVIGKIVSKNKTTEEITDYITEKLKGKYLVNPIVTVKVSQSNRRTFFIQGSVHKPGVYQIEGKVSLLKLITIAGGLTDDYGSVVKIFREKGSGGPNGRSDSEGMGDYEIIQINIAELLEGDLKRNIAVKASDIVQIPPAKPIFVVGEVGKPGAFPYKEKMSLLEAVITAGGFSDKAGGNAFIFRESNSGSDAETDEKYEVLEVRISELLQGDPEKNVLLQPKDFVQISTAGTYYIAGEVNLPGAFQMSKQGNTIRQAVAMAKGVKYEGNLKKSLLFRVNSSGQREKIEVNLEPIISGKGEDMELLSDDILLIPNSKGKSITKSIFGAITNRLPTALIRGY